jgi:hypothetical protein
MKIREVARTISPVCRPFRDLTVIQMKNSHLGISRRHTRRAGRHKRLPGGFLAEQPIWNQILIANLTNTGWCYNGFVVASLF